MKVLIVVLLLVLLLVFLRILYILLATWRVSLPIIALLGVLIALFFCEKIPEFLHLLLMPAIGLLSFGLCIGVYEKWSTRCPKCKKFMLRFVDKNINFVSETYYKRGGKDGGLHPYQKVKGENVYQCGNCGYECSSSWTHAECLDDE